MNNVVKQGLFTIILVFFCSSYLQAALYAEIDREQVNIGERFYLTLEIQGEHSNPPDLSNLGAEFHLNPAQRSVLTTHKTGLREVRTRWLIALRPKHSGRLEISALSFQEHTSEPLYIAVSETPSQPATPIQPHFGTDLSINLITDREQVYRNAQLLVTLDIYHNQPLPETVDFIPPQLAAGRVRTLDLPQTRVDEVSGEAYFHTRLRFAVFPDEVGLLEISGPGLRLPEENSFSITELYADMPDVEVLAPTEINPQQNWLPSNNLFMTDTTYALEDGLANQLIRQLSLVAVGTTLDKLPASLINTPPPAFYQLLSRESEEHHSSQGITSQIHETWIIRPTEPGELMHPASGIGWWDTLSEQNRYTQPQQPGIEQLISETQPAVQPSSLATNQPALNSPETSTRNIRAYATPTLAGLTVLLVTLTAVYAFYRQRKKATTEVPVLRHTTNQPKPRQTTPAVQQAEQTPAIPQVSEFHRAAVRSEHQAFMQLSEACQHNAGKPACSALILWAACFWLTNKLLIPNPSTRPMSVRHSTICCWIWSIT
ncbi:hypothetical protein LH51_15875 [Nitrincola sp. A-D6]|uniref:BatD family protein n=1 Tax=Nitrincola sp. A-D6 TaxID=1545442 RepID=UPI00051FA2FF|nr:BatD family protein [Nitrincola sp. A-D6]KGK41274.1 hypothetical protein LH51_15875 [Nitrincola sp. A-D6]